MKVRILVLTGVMAAVSSFGCTKQTPIASSANISQVSDKDSGKEAETALTEYKTLGMTFLKNAIVKDITIKDCTLVDGTQSTCKSITVSGYPSNYEAGPFCPRTTADSKETTGIWLDGENVYNLDGEFIKKLPQIYDDENFVLYDSNGNVNVTDTQEEFDGAAKPQVEEEYKYNCVEGKIEWLEGGSPVQTTVEIPANPKKANTVTRLGSRVGVTINGVVIDGPAPVQAILSAYTIAAFDDCGGHINPVTGYHQHGITGCFGVQSKIDGETKLVGYAMDGFPIHSAYEESNQTPELDECGGHEVEGVGYHYHANKAEKNSVISCFHGTLVEGQQNERGGRPPQGKRPPVNTRPRKGIPPVGLPPKQD